MECDSIVKFSVIVPIYKVEAYLHQCIDSILVQTYPNFELILVDDGSPDNCGKICDEYAAKDARIKVIHKPNGGLVSARKAGIQNAKGDYVCWVDGDDFVGQEHLQKIKEIIDQFEPEMVTFGYTRTKQDGTKGMIFFDAMQRDHLYSTSEKGFYDRMLYDLEDSGTPNYGSLFHYLCCKVIKREIIQECLLAVPNEIRIGEDAAATFTSLCKCKTVYVSSLCSYFYRYNNESILHTFRKDELHRRCVLFEFLTHSIDKIPQRNIDAYAFVATLHQMIDAIAYFNNYRVFLKYAREEIPPNLRNIIQRTPMLAADTVKRKILYYLFKKGCYIGLWLNFHTKEKLKRACFIGKNQ